LFVGFTTSVVISQVGADELGRWRFAQAMVLYLMVGTDAGLTMLAVREVARRPASASMYALPVLATRLVLAALALSVSFMIISPGRGDATGWFYFAMFLTIVPAALSLMHIAQGLEMMRVYAGARFASGAVAGLLGLLAFIVTQDLVWLPIPVIAIGLVVDLGLALYLRARISLPMRVGTPREWIGLLIPAFPFLVGAVAIQVISSADAIIIRTTLGERALGIYAAPYVLAAQLLLLSGPVSLAIYPRLAALHAQASGFDRAVRDLLGVLGLFVLPICAGAALVAPSLVTALYGPEYEESVPLLTILMGMPLVGFYNGVMGQALNAARLQGTVARVAAVAAVLSVIQNAILVPTVGLAAAATAAVVTEVVTAAAYTWRMGRLTGLAPIRAYLATSDAVIVMLIVLLALPDFGLPITASIGMAIYALTVLVRRPASFATLRRMIEH
jgi:O-antigen/teichoic acid export membrane protein